MPQPGESAMLVTNKNTTPVGRYEGFRTAFLIGARNSGQAEISIQITEVAAGGMQFLHTHPEAQCYYVVSGAGLVFADDDQRAVGPGDAVFIPSGAVHGIKNVGAEILVYLTANRAFGAEKENQLWPEAPGW
jgi:quercetin dioxygenase-like cupin family protein